MLKPRLANLSVLGYGPSVGGSVKASVCYLFYFLKFWKYFNLVSKVYVVKTFEELKANPKKAEGKIVVFNAPFVTYGETVKYRSSGAAGN